eukprot:NODE_27_length_33950_cov_0.349739.p14 type:complete len:182 gc:universal NODE_27_length_33950_cov_0.349739:33310-32765(-)
MSFSKKSNSEKALEEYTHNAKKLGLRFGLIGLGLGLGGNFIGTRYSPAWKSISIGPKTFLISAAGIAGFVLGSERAAFISSGSSHYTTGTSVNSSSWRDSLEQNKYKIVGSVWAISMLGAMAYLSTQKTMKFSEKIVQGRMIAQAATVGAILASAIASSTSSKSVAPEQDWAPQKAANPTP